MKPEPYACSHVALVGQNAITVVSRPGAVSGKFLKTRNEITFTLTPIVIKMPILKITSGVEIYYHMWPLTS